MKRILALIPLLLISCTPYSHSLKIKPENIQEARLISNREQWLFSAGVMLQEKVEKEHGKPLKPWHVSLGKNRSHSWIGYSIHQSGGYCDLFISPDLSDSTEVLATLMHELIHVAIKGGGHGEAFTVLALKLGLTGPMTATSPGEDCRVYLKSIIDQIGEYPNS
jgi:hypothetical protein